MPAQAIHYFMLSPYSVVMDVKMLDFFRHMGTATLISVTVLLIASLFIRHAWCRYLCPYGALMGVVSLLSPFKIRRNAESCIDCGKCAKNCPSRIPVDKLIQVRTSGMYRLYDLRRVMSGSLNIDLFTAKTCGK